jgi:hypothetical protein
MITLAVAPQGTSTRMRPIRYTSGDAPQQHFAGRWHGMPARTHFSAIGRIWVSSRRQFIVLGHNSFAAEDMAGAARPLHIRKSELEQHTDVVNAPCRMSE